MFRCLEPVISKILEKQFRLLTYQQVRFDLEHDFAPYFIYIVAIAWAVGIGRYWDHPDAYIWQYAGLGSISYIFVLSTFLYWVLKPIKPERWSFKMVLLFVGFTSLPGLLYAIPVERFLELPTAQAVNAWFLGIVALWRVSLYVVFLRRGAGMGKFGVFIGTLLPLSAIVLALALLNLEHVIFEIMAGIREEDKSPNDIAYIVVFTLSILAYALFPVTVICYGIEIYRRRNR